MNPQNGNGWPPVPGGGTPSVNNEHALGQQRQPGTFGYVGSLYWQAYR